MFYAAKNSWVTETSIGFADTWYVIGFATKQMRDTYVEQAKDRATRTITSQNIKEYGGKVGQIGYYDSLGHFMVYVGDGHFARDCCDVDPLTMKHAH